MLADLTIAMKKMDEGATVKWHDSQSTALTENDEAADPFEQTRQVKKENLKHSKTNLAHHTSQRDREREREGEREREIR